MLKYSIFAYIILLFILLYQINLAVSAKKNLEKRVMGISTQIKELETYETKISNLNNGD